jgi:hypothetical protein
LSSDSDIRDWARQQGLRVAVRGRLPADVRSAYSAAHSPSAMAGEDQADIAVTEDEEQVIPDPPPNRPAPGARDKVSKSKAPRVTAELKRSIRGKLALLTLAPLGLARHYDPVCGGALVEVKDDLLDWAVDGICDSPDLLKWFSAGKGYMRLVTLLTILEPVGITACQHHVTHTLHAPDAREEVTHHGGYDYPAAPAGYLPTDQARDYQPV